MSIVLGINANHADSSACLIINGKLEAGFEEERIIRKKHFSGFPINSIRKCLDQAGINENDVTDIAFNTNPISNLLPKSIFFLKNLFKNKDITIKRIVKKINQKKTLLNNFNINTNVKFHNIEHHIAHIASAYYPSKFNDAVGLSIDGSGDFVSVAISKCKKNKIKIIKKYFFPNSLGIFYHAMTQFMGFNNYGDEYKIMGMAAYGNPKYFDLLKNNLFINQNNSFKLNLNYFNHQKSNFRYIVSDEMIIDNIFNENLIKLFNLKSFQIKSDESFLKDLAASVQKVYEFFFEKILTDISKMKYSENLVYAGGCGLNSSANRIITNNEKYFKNIFIPYAPGDNGGALGAALVVASINNKTIQNTENPYIGQCYKDSEIKEILKSKLHGSNLQYRYFSEKRDVIELAAEMISKSRVIGWFQNKMEFGPRALGNRSILADPRNPNMRNIINSKIKRRESFRPFAPSIMEEYQSDWFNTNYSSPYMSTIASVKKDKINLIPAVTHVDETARYQSVNKLNNDKFYELIKTFYKITGVPILLNTSFNENEPIVMRPDEALDCLIRTDMDALFIGNYMITKSTS